MKSRICALFCASVLTLVACDEPGIEEYIPQTGIIQGSVAYQTPAVTNPACQETPPRGPVILGLFAADNPPPPAGTGSPLNVVVIPESQLFPEGAVDGELFTADFTIPTVPGGEYLISAFLDADGDFNPVVDLLQQPTAGDVVGGFLSTEVPGTLATVEVFDGQVTSQVVVQVGQTVPLERPSFAVDSAGSWETPLLAPGSLVISTRALDHSAVKVDANCSGFLVRYADDNRDGVPDDVNGDHLPDLYPRVILRKLGQPPGAATIFVPLIINPFLFMDTLDASPTGTAVVQTLEAIVPPVAVQQDDAGRTLLPAPPEGSYEVVVISSSGQTWAVPNDLNSVDPLPDGPDLSQSQAVEFVAGPPLPAGSIQGTVRTTTVADTFVFAFSASNPPPPQGSGSPVAVDTISADELAAGDLVAPFSLQGLEDGQYIVVALVDTDHSFSLFVDLVAQASAGDWSGSTVVALSGIEDGVEIIAGLQVPSDRPAFQIGTGAVSLDGYLALEFTDLPELGITAQSAAPIVLPAAGDLEGDNLADFQGRAILTRLADEGVPQLAETDPTILIPLIMDPLPFWKTLEGGQPFVRPARLGFFVPPFALTPTARGLERIAPIPAGRYTVNYLSSTSQTWSVPSDLDVTLGRLGTSLENPEQGAYIQVVETSSAAGQIAGMVQLGDTPPLEYQVVVTAFSVANLPPPQGSGTPVATALVSAADFDATGVATFGLGPLPPGNYFVFATLDADDSFVPWLASANQPTRGDWAGGDLELPAETPRLLQVSAGEITVSQVTVSPLLGYPNARPAFALPDNAVHDGMSNLILNLTPLSVTDGLISTEGEFPVQWVDLDGNGVADDRNGDTIPDLYPMVVAQHLTDDGASLAADGFTVMGILDPSQFVGLGFPAANPMAVDTVVLAPSLQVVFPPLGVAAEAPSTPAPIVDGLYRVTLINSRGQTWSTPNRLATYAGSDYEATQGRFLAVQP